MPQLTLGTAPGSPHNAGYGEAPKTSPRPQPARQVELVPSWYIGDRSSQSAWEFLTDLRKRLSHRIQLTSDGHKAYLLGVAGSFGDDVDFAQLVKIYCKPDSEPGFRRYSAPECVGAVKTPVYGDLIRNISALHLPSVTTSQ